MEFDIKPYEGIGPIKFGMDRADVRKTLIAPYNEYKQSQYAHNTSDAFDNIGVTVHYDETDKCESVSIWLKHKVSFKGDSFFNKPAKQIIKWFNKIDKLATVGDENILTSIKHGIAVGFDEPIEDPNSKVNSIIVFNLKIYVVLVLFL